MSGVPEPGNPKTWLKSELHKRTRDGLGSWCRACVNEARRVVPRYVHLDGATVANPDPRPKSKVR